MGRALCIFEDRKAKNFYPLTLTRPVWDLRCGITTLLEKVLRMTGKDIRANEEDICLFCRPYLAAVTFQKNKAFKINELEGLKEKDVLFINGRLLFLGDKEIFLEGEEELGVQGDDIVYARLNKSTLRKLSFDSPERIEDTLLQARRMLEVKEIKFEEKINVQLGENLFRGSRVGYGTSKCEANPGR